MKAARPSYRIVPYDERWPAWVEEEKAGVVAALGVDEGWVEHCGSTAVPGLAAKPILDMVAGVESVPAVDEAHARFPALAGLGYECRGETVPGMLYIRKAGPRRYNLHVTRHGGGLWVETLLFRDYLRAHRDVAGEYERLKRELMAGLAHDPPAYNDGKAAFIRSVVERARRESAAV
jgi:GrpB-like predicted nucleotidyltransferase (UPF0157 family)